MSERSLFGLSNRLPPANLEAEQALLGALLANNKAYERVADYLDPEHFADAIHGRIYSAIRRRVENGQLADAVTLRQEFDAAGDLQEVGGSAYLAQLLGAMVGIVNAGEYGKLIRDCWLRRQLIDRIEVASERAFGSDPNLDADGVIEALEGDLLALQGSSRDQNAGSYDSAAVARDCAAQLEDSIERPGVLAGIPTGLTALDRRIGGLIGGKLYLLAGATSMGKTALAGRITKAAAEEGFAVDYVSCEMPPRDIMNRLICAHSQMPLTAVERGFIEYPDGRLYRFPRGSREMMRIGEAQRHMGSLPITWLDAAGPSIPQLFARWRQLKRKKKLDLIVVDYLQLLTASPNAQRQNKNAEVSELSQSLKKIAKQLDVPVLALSQLKRGVQEREMKRPQLSDLRESGSLEQDADVVLFVYREHYYLSRSKPTQKDKESTADFNLRTQEWDAKCIETKGKAEIDVAKQRGGPTGIIPVAFRDEFVWFDNLPETVE